MTSDSGTLAATLRESEARYRALFESSPVAVYAIDASGRIQDFNPRAAELWGRTPVLGDTDERFCGSLKMYLPDGTYLPHDRCPMATVASGEIAEVRNAEVVIERPDGSRITVVVNIVPLKNGNGEITGAINCFHDITERSHAERKTKEQAETSVAVNEALLIAGLRQQEFTSVVEVLNAKLRAEIVERTRAEEAQKRAVEQLGAADRQKDAFMAMLAHELRNPLAPIRNAAHIVLLARSDNPSIIRAQEVIERQAANLAKLVDDLLDVSRIQQGKVRLRKEKLDLSSAISRVADSLGRPAKAQDHTITLALERFPPLYIDADSTRIDQILANLIGNAVKYTPAQGTIHITAAREAGMAVVRVRDSGIGIEPVMLLRIFDVFMQVEQSLERSQGGLGLGLKLVKELVELHGGTVEAKSDGPGKGSEFVLRLPVVLEKDGQKPIAPAVARPGPRVPSRRILVVDDNADNRETLEMVLSLSGHRVDVAGDGQLAVEKALQNPPDVAFVDIGLPILSGYEVARAIRKQPGGDRIVLIALSGYGQPEDKRNALDAGFDAHFTKPVESDALTRVLTDLEGFKRPAETSSPR